MKQTVRFHECADLRDLSRAVIAQAVRDLRHSNPIRRLDAFLFLTGDDFPVWAEIMDAPFMDPYKMLSSGNAKRLRTVFNDK